MFLFFFLSFFFTCYFVRLFLSIFYLGLLFYTVSLYIYLSFSLCFYLSRTLSFSISQSFTSHLFSHFQYRVLFLRICHFYNILVIFYCVGHFLNCISSSSSSIYSLLCPLSLSLSISPSLVICRLCCI